MLRRWLCVFAFGVCFSACQEGKREVKEIDRLPEIFPDYKAVTVPVNIAPLNFMLDGAESIEVQFSKSGTILLTCRGKQGIYISLKKWRRLMA